MPSQFPPNRGRKRLRKGELLRIRHYQYFLSCSKEDLQHIVVPITRELDKFHTLYFLDKKDVHWGDSLHSTSRKSCLFLTWQKNAVDIAIELTKHICKKNGLKHSIILALMILCLSATAISQDTLFSLPNCIACKFDSVLDIVTAGTKYGKIYNKDVLKYACPVTDKFQNLTPNTAIARLMKKQPYLLHKRKNDVFEFSVNRPAVENMVPDHGPNNFVFGTIYDQDSIPLENATITIPGTDLTVTSNGRGEYVIQNVPDSGFVIITYVNHLLQKIAYNKGKKVVVWLQRAFPIMDSYTIVAQIHVSSIKNTGHITKINVNDELPGERDFIMNANGVMPGLEITGTSGVAGTGPRIQTRGESYLDLPGRQRRSEPLLTINGVPLPSGNSVLTQQPSAMGDPKAIGTAGGLRVLGMWNADDIDNIELLTDADATAIYGSRGANGVIAITTKRAKGKKFRLSASMYSGSGRVVKLPQLYNTGDYINMRREAFNNDHKIPDKNNAPDLMAWDTNRYTNWAKYLIGNKVRYTNILLSLMGGNRLTSWLLSASRMIQTSPYPGSFADTRHTLYLTLYQRGENDRWHLTFNGLYSSDDNHLPGTDPIKGIYLVPNAPPLKDSTGKLTWKQADVSFSNPFSYLYQDYRCKTSSWIANLQSNISLIKHLNLNILIAASGTETKETGLFPIAAQNPALSPTGSFEFSTNAFNSWMTQLQIEYSKTIFKKCIFTSQAGITLEQQKNDRLIVSAKGLTNDAQLGTMLAAPSLSANNPHSEYRYMGGYLRLNFDIKNRYVINLTAREDGSTRFSPENQVGKFGALGLAWIISEEPFFNKLSKWINFAKLRTSAGITGNDQIGDYMFYNLYSPVQTYQPTTGASGIVSTHPYNASFQWEINRKVEVAMELQILQFITADISIYMHRSGNLLIPYLLPAQSGYASIYPKNFPASIQNSGLEILIEKFKKKNTKKNRLQWTATLALTIPRNKLIDFPGLDNSSYKSTLEIGQSLTLQKGVIFDKVDPQTGLYTFKDVKDTVVIGNKDPKLYGGVRFSFYFNRFQLSFKWTGRKIPAINPIYYAYTQGAPGQISNNLLNNQLAILTNRWTKPEDVADIQKLSTTTNAGMSSAINNYINSDKMLVDGSYLRLSDISISYTFPLIKKTKVQATGYVQALNLFTITRYKNADPETGTINVLPPLRMFIGGFKISL